MKRIPLYAQGGVIRAWAQVSDEDYEYLSGWRWRVRWGYASTDRREGGRAVGVVMHRIVWERMAGRALLAGEQIDHINRETLDNRRENLRVVNNVQNQMNRGGHRTYKGKPTSSQYKGVFWHAKGKKWMAAIGVENRSKYLGLFASEEEAARAYDAAARRLYGEYACCNFEEAAP